ncbi:ImmA/IrrE family metallo-endopeptidase [Rhodoblastus sp.]|uniref:ImmA/IrrE family metallo-endopeptidase n=1 Tax=Rhodoblastus sp. TaxID=1962975 RepID=UPI0025FA8552|nr:ImmA/IrrE family metallo-endopeptidase [Rhodoblastus sp.]
MDDTRELISALKRAGLSDHAIRAAWPSWWDDDAAASKSGKAELRFALARKLGLSPKSLLGERVEFVWKNDARFKNLAAVDADELAALASFGVSVGRLLVRATPPGQSIEGIPAEQLRAAILRGRQVVDLLSLLTTCWGLGIPVIFLRVFPLNAKSMRAMVIGVEGRHAVLLGRESQYPAPLAFTLAHELGHAALGHAQGGNALVDVADPDFDGGDPEEEEADRYGLELLTGSPKPAITTNTQSYGARSLAEAAILAGPSRGIEPGTLALCLGYIQKNWAAANAALRHIYDEPRTIWNDINRLASSQLQWDELSDESSTFLKNVMFGVDA